MSPSFPFFLFSSLLVLLLLLLLFFLNCRRQLENKMVNNHKDTMTKTGAMLLRNRGCWKKGCDHKTFSSSLRLYNITVHILIFVCKFRHAQYQSSLKTIQIHHNWFFWFTIFTLGTHCILPIYLGCAPSSVRCFQINLSLTKKNTLVYEILVELKRLLHDLFAGAQFYESHAI